MNKKERTFAEFVEKFKEQGYEVHVTTGFLESLEELEQSRKFSLWDLPPIPFELLEDLVDKMPRSCFTKWLSSWTATLAIYANRPLLKKLVSRIRKPQKSYRIA